MQSHPRDPRAGALAALALAALCTTAPAFAAGGHHSVDDAATLATTECEAEGWLARARGGERLLHAGIGCRVGPVELGAYTEHARFQGESATGWGLEVKWAREVSEGFSLGVSVAPAWQARVRPRYQGTAVTALATWTPRHDLALHLNAGRELVHRGRDETRYGAAVEWAPVDDWTLLAERYREGGAHFARVGARWAVNDALSLDLSRAHRLGGGSESAWTFGVTWLLPR